MSCVPHTIRIAPDTWAGIHVVRAVLLARVGRNITLDRVLRFLVEVFREARVRDPRIVEAALDRVFADAVAPGAR